MLATRLLDKLVPHSYALKLDVDMETFTFSAEETVEATLNTASHHLVMHASGLSISSCLLSSGQSAKAILVDEITQTVTFEFSTPIPAGITTMYLIFSGTIKESLHGFYRSQYTEEGQTKWLATTQFEAVHAREAFVCIDEPAAKAIFQLTLLIPEGLSAISNTPIVHNSSLCAGRKLLEFAPTPRMSTYVVAYIIGNFDHVETYTSEGVVVRAYATPGKQAQLQFALETAARTLSFFQDYFGIPYPLDKLDMVAVPDFASGAMENWGAITYRETALLLDPHQTSTAQKQRVAEVVTHELAHQWFGNLVTMSWWNDLWLNEGFASWIEVLAQDQLFPQWQVWEQFISGDYASALTMDSLANTHSIEVEVEDPRELDEIFDRISYAKGASIINMLHGYLGAEAFRRGLQHYLQRHAYGNTKTADLWQSLEESSGKPVTKMMSVWTKLPGYPVLKLEADIARQHRFYASPYEAKAASDRDTVWPIPYATISSQGKITASQMVTTSQKSVPTVSAEWTKPNPGQTGFYRVNYAPEQLMRLASPMVNMELPPVDRYGVINDIFACAEAGYTSAVVGLKLIQILRAEKNLIAWHGLNDGLLSILAITEDKRQRNRLEVFGRWFIQPNLDRLGWEEQPNEDYFDTLLRPVILQTAIRYGHPAVVDEAHKRFWEYVSSGSASPDLRPSLLLSASRYGSTEEYEAILKLYQAEDIPQTKNTLLSALSRFRQPKLFQRTLDYGLSDHVREQDIIYTLGPALLNYDNRDLAWIYLQKQWSELVRRFGSGGHMLSYLPGYVGTAYASEAKAQEISSFFTSHPHPAIRRSVAQAVEAVRIKVAWAERDGTAIEEFINGWEEK